MPTLIATAIALILLGSQLNLQAQSTGTIEGRVTLSDKTPLENISLVCTSRDRSVVRETTSDAEGKYRCSVPPGVYRVRALFEGFDTRYFSQELGSTSVGEDGRGIRVRAGASVNGDFVIVRSASISGHVLDNDGNPIKYAQVSVEAEPADNSGAIVSTRGTGVSIGETGEFSIAGLQPGAYRLRVLPPERGAPPDKDGRQLLPTWYPGIVDPQAATPIQIAGGDQIVAMDVSLIRGRPGIVSGRVIRPDGAPLTRGVISAVFRTATSMYARSFPIDNDGGFRMTSLMPGTYDLTVNGEGVSPLIIHDGLTIGTADISGLVVRLRDNGRVSGRVRFEGVDTPPSGSIMIAALNERPDSITSRITSDENWAFDFPSLPGTRVLRVSDLPAGWSLKAIVMSGRDITNEAVDMSEGLSDIDIVLTRRMSTMRGVVELSAESGLPADAAVLVFAADPSSWTPFSTMTRRAWPDDDGGFVISELQPGRYAVIAVERTPANFLRSPTSVLNALLARAKIVLVPDHETVDVPLTMDSTRE